MATTKPAQQRTAAQATPAAETDNIAPEVEVVLPPGTMKIKAKDPEQGDFIIINEADFNKDEDEEYIPPRKSARASS